MLQLPHFPENLVNFVCKSGYLVYLTSPPYNSLIVNNTFSLIMCNFWRAHKTKLKKKNSFRNYIISHHMTHAQDTSKVRIISSEPKTSPQKTDSICRSCKNPVILSIPCSMNPASVVQCLRPSLRCNCSNYKITEISFWSLYWAHFTAEISRWFKWLSKF